eukprot:12895265-Prorocentrum_lima.AAC.1
MTGGASSPVGASSPAGVDTPTAVETLMLSFALYRQRAPSRVDSRCVHRHACATGTHAKQTMRA